MRTNSRNIPFKIFAPFGSPLIGRTYQAETLNGYRYSFNGKEKDNETYGDGNCIAFEARIYDSRLGRFFSRDPLENEYPWQSTYCFAANNPIALIDFLGMGPGDSKTQDPKIVQKGEGAKSFADRNHRTLDQIASANPNVFRNYPKNGTEEEKNNYWKTNEKLSDGKPKFMIHPGQVLAIGPSADQPKYVYVTEPTIQTPSPSGQNGQDQSKPSESWAEAYHKGLDYLDLACKGDEKSLVFKDRWLGNNGKYYGMNQGCNQYTGSKKSVIAAAKYSKWLGRTVTAGQVIVGGIEIYEGYNKDGKKFGYNAQLATGSNVGSMAGGYVGFETGLVVGGELGACFGGVGAIPGAIVGGLWGGWYGGKKGSELGTQTVKKIHGK